MKFCWTVRSPPMLLRRSNPNSELRYFGGFGLAPSHYPVGLKTHGTARKHPTSSWDLCELARPEYTALGRLFPAECKGTARGTRPWRPRTHRERGVTSRAFAAGS